MNSHGDMCGRRSCYKGRYLAIAVAGCRYRGRLLLTSRSFRFLARLKAFSGGLVKIFLVVRRIWKFLEMIFSAKAELNCENLQILKKMLDKSSQFLSSEQPNESKSLDVALNIAGVEKIRSENLRFAANPEAIRFKFCTERSFSDGGYLCPLWSVILKSV